MQNMYDVVIIGGGPAGLTAALYLARAKYRVVVVEKEKFGGQITITNEVVNYPGVEKTTGAQLTETMRKQAESFGAEFMLAQVNELDLSKDIKSVKTDKGELKCFGVLAATGAHPRTIGFQGEMEFRGRGVAYCATCDGEFFTGKEVFVIGGGFAAAEEAVFLTKYAKHVTILIRGDDFSCAKFAADAARNHEKITVLTNTIVEKVSGDNVVRSIHYKNKITGEVTEYRAEEKDNIGVFVFAGYAPATGLLKGVAQLNEQGYVITDHSMKTNVDGLYAAGDVCVKALRQVVTAVGDGALAATELEKYALSMHRKTGIVPVQPINTEDKPQKEQVAATSDITSGSKLFDNNMLTQLRTVFQRMENKLILELYMDDRSVSMELKNYLMELAVLTEKLELREVTDDKIAKEDYPCVRICKADGRWTGLAFHGVPGGHEFTSFVLGLYNAAGEGQAIDSMLSEKIRSVDKDVNFKILVSLSCTMCPDLVIAAQKIASINENITAEVYDINHFSEIKEKYNVMSVPCLIINEGEKVTFGKKDIRQLIALIEDI